jgi:hypothetical protein
MVELIEWTDFVVYLDELRNAITRLQNWCRAVKFAVRALCVEGCCKA